MYAIRSYYENRSDLAAAAERGLGGAMIDRLALDKARIAQMAAGIEEVAALPDPVGEVDMGGSAYFALVIGPALVITSYSIHYTKLYEERSWKRKNIAPPS